MSLRFRPAFALFFLGLAFLNRGPLAATEIAELEQRLQALVNTHAGRVALGVKHLETGAECFVQADEPMPTASLIKLPVMIAAYRAVDAGTLDLDTKITLQADDRVQGSGILTTHFSPGTQISVRDAIRLMIAFSDNTATNLVVDQIGLPTTAKVMEDLGYPGTKLHAKVFRGDTSIFPERSKQFGLGSTTAREMIRLLESLHRKEIARPASCDAMLQHLLACDDRIKFPRDLPRTTRVAHKTGSVNAVRTDAGILLGPHGPIAVCVLTADNEDQRWADDNAGDVLCGKVAKAVVDFFSPAATAASADPKTPRTMSAGASGVLVEALQRTLNERLDPSPDLGVDGDFGPATLDAVKRFQQGRKLPVTGEVDAAMWRALSPLRHDPIPPLAPEIVNAEQLSRREELSWNSPPLVTCKAWAIADAKTGVLLWSSGEREPLDFASTTKMMTAFLVIRLAAEKPAVLDEIITFTERADQTLGSTADVRAGEQVSVRELLYGLMLPSGNDASVAFAEHFGERYFAREGESDAVEAFVNAMNEAAGSLGMKQTRYRNPHGLTAPDHRSTAADLLILARAARRFPLFRELVNTRQRGCTLQSVSGYSRNVVWKNTNQLLGLTGYHGVKTGTTEAAGACLVSSAERNGDELIVAVLGSANSDARYVDTRNLIRWAWTRR